MTTNLQAFHITTTETYEDNLSQQLSLLGAAAVICRDAGNQPLYEPAPDEYLQWKETLLTAFFEESPTLPAIKNYLLKQQAEGIIVSFSQETVPDENWVQRNQEQFPPLCFGKRLWIHPTWHTPPASDAINVILNPGCAFGTGTHPTTALCLEWLDTNIHGNETVIDYGCGSGLLAIAALKLGAKHAFAVDYDPQALDATLENAAQNQLSDDVITITAPENFKLTTVDILIANIISKPLIMLAPQFANLVKPNGKIVLSGLLETQLAEVKNAYLPWFSIENITQKEEWLRLEGTRLST